MSERCKECARLEDKCDRLYKLKTQWGTVYAAAHEEAAMALRSHIALKH